MKQREFIFTVLSICLSFIITGNAVAAGANGQQTDKRQSAVSATAEAAVEGEVSCRYCGMDRAKFAHSRMLIEYEDGTSVGTCSIHCLAVELANSIDKSPKAIRVGDYNSRKLIDAETAYWVIGGSKTGVMSSRAKWAFEKKTDAEAFNTANGGSLATFEDALKAAYEDLYRDTRMIREKRKMMHMKKMEQK